MEQFLADDILILIHRAFCDLSEVLGASGTLVQFRTFSRILDPLSHGFKGDEFTNISRAALLQYIKAEEVGLEGRKSLSCTGTDPGPPRFIYKLKPFRPLQRTLSRQESKALVFGHSTVIDPDPSCALRLLKED